jgi:hypothetical protein
MSGHQAGFPWAPPEVAESRQAIRDEAKRLGSMLLAIAPLADLQPTSLKAISDALMRLSRDAKSLKNLPSVSEGQTVPLGPAHKE